MAGRRNTSPAMRHRMHYRVLPPYSEKEMLEIVSNKGIPSDETVTLVKQYIQAQKSAKPPCFRDLMTQVESGAEKSENKTKYEKEKAEKENIAIFAGVTILEKAIARQSTDIEFVQNIIATQVLHCKKSATAVLDLSNLNLTTINLNQFDLKNVKKFNLTDATLSTEQINHLMRYTNNFSNVAVIGPGKIEAKEDLNFNGADLRGTEFDSFQSYKTNIFDGAKINDKQFFQMCAGGLINTVINTNYQDVSTDNLSNLDIRNLDLSKLKIDNKLDITGAVLTAKQANYLYTKGVTCFRNVVILNSPDEKLKDEFFSNPAVILAGARRDNGAVSQEKANYWAEKTKKTEKSGCFFPFFSKPKIQMQPVTTAQQNVAPSALNNH